ncbi:hypothetical protein BH09BAC1_BH09BAC1_11160 [soil metagenome]
MKKILGIAALAGSICTGAFAQADLTYAIASLEGYSRTEVVRLLLTSQYDGSLLLLSDEANLDNYNKSKDAPATDKNMVIIGNKPFYPELAKEKQPGKEYTEIQVVNLNGRNLTDIVIGSVTNTLDKETRYIEVTKEDMESPLVMSAIPAMELSAVDNTQKFAYSTTQNYTVGTAKGKFFIITEDNTYRYYDSNKLGGRSKLVEELKKGKPITANTFFYEAQENGLIDPEMTLKQFLQLSVEEHRQLLMEGE